jgi:tetratricopeptide (TPR) repeat protein
VIGDAHFLRGVTSYPAIGDAAVALSTPDLMKIYAIDKTVGVELGRLQQDTGVTAYANIHDMITKHFAILGSTGVGKSSGLASLLRQISAVRPDLRIFLLDGHNEYAHCFGDRALVINPANFKLPFWLFTFEELLEVACLVGLALFGLAGCNTFSEVPAPPAADQVAPTATLQNAGDIKYYPSDEPLKLGLEYFKKGSYGIANRYFRDAVEKAPEDAEAWIGLAASYDRLRRFDLADQAYATAIKLTGETVQILNDRGYSYLLRGDLGKARAKFLKAYQLDPTNPTVINNIQLLNSSYRFVERIP